MSNTNVLFVLLTVFGLVFGLFAGATLFATTQEVEVEKIVEVERLVEVVKTETEYVDRFVVEKETVEVFKDRFVDRQILNLVERSRSEFKTNFTEEELSEHQKIVDYTLHESSLTWNKDEVVVTLNIELKVFDSFYEVFTYTVFDVTVTYTEEEVEDSEDELEEVVRVVY